MDARRKEDDMTNEITITKTEAGTYDIVETDAPTLTGSRKLAWARKTAGRRYEVFVENGATTTVRNQAEALDFVRSEINPDTGDLMDAEPADVDESVMAEIDAEVLAVESDADITDADGVDATFEALMANPPKAEKPKAPKKDRGPTVLQQMLELAATVGADFRAVAKERGVRWESCYDPMYFAVKKGTLPEGVELVRVKGLEGHGRRFVAFTREGWARFAAENTPEGVTVTDWTA
jgi:hypothetical protein